MRRPIPRFMVVLDRATARCPLPDVARAALSGGADMVQVREKDLDTNALRVIVEAVIEAVSDPAYVSINGDGALAAELRTSLHLPERSEVSRSSLRLNDRVLLGRSVHSADARWFSDEVDYVTLGHLFETASKPGKPGLGADSFADIAQRFSVPVLAIGGIRPETVSTAFGAGAQGVAVSSYVNSAMVPARAAREIGDQIDAWMKSTGGIPPASRLPSMEGQSGFPSTGR